MVETVAQLATFARPERFVEKAAPNNWITNKEGKEKDVWYRISMQEDGLALEKRWLTEQGRVYSCNSVFLGLRWKEDEERKREWREWNKHLTRDFDKAVLEMQDLWYQRTPNPKYGFVDWGTQNPFTTISGSADFQTLVTPQIQQHHSPQEQSKEEMQRSISFPELDTAARTLDELEEDVSQIDYNDSFYDL